MTVRSHWEDGYETHIGVGFLGEHGEAHWCAQRFIHHNQLQVSTDAGVSELQSRLQRLQQSQQLAAVQLSAASGSARRAPASAPPAAPPPSFGVLFARALPQPHVMEFSLPGEFTLMRDIPYQHVDVNKYPPEHRPKKLRAGAIQVCLIGALFHVLLTAR